MTTGDDLELLPLGPGDLGGLLAAYQRAQELADDVRAALARQGFTDDMVVVQPGLCASGEPVVRVVLAGVAAGRLAGLLVTGRDGGPPRRDVPTHPPSGEAGRAA
jgi:hypothetical protein